MTERKYLDRSTPEPGGMECGCCGEIFIGDEAHDLCAACAFMAPLRVHRLPVAAAPKGAPVLIAGGIAMKKKDGKWYSGMTDDPFTRELNWTPKWWACIPQQND